MFDLILIILATVLVNNFVLVKFLGLCPLLGASTRLETAAGMSLATTFVLTLAATLSYLVDTWLLIPFELQYLRLIVSDIFGNIGHDNRHTVDNGVSH